MKLIANVGNTNINWGFTESPDEIKKVLTTATSTNKTALNNSLKKVRSFFEADGIIIGGVVPDAISKLSKCSETFFDKKNIVILGFDEFKSLMQIDLKTKILPGTDRLANAFALKKIHKTPACVVDVGTAITIDAVDAHGSYIGGSIGPGEKLQLASLQENTAQLAKVKKLPKSMPAVGSSTAEAIAIGIRRAIPYGIMGIIMGIEELFSGELDAIVVTGGGGLETCMFLEKIFPNVIYDEIYTLKGLATAYWELSEFIL